LEKEKLFENLQSSYIEYNGTRLARKGISHGPELTSFDASWRSWRPQKDGLEAMHKLVILIEAFPDRSAFDDGWPDFLHWLERMPGVQREASSAVDEFLFGAQPYMLMHELYFHTLAEAHQAMVSPAGRAAGVQLQRITNGRFVLFFADHKEDDMENIRSYQGDDAESGI
jgi:hypothetical protein